MKSQINYQCGCRYKTADYKEAVEHARTTGHTLTVQGTIRPERQQALLAGK
jgi:hypothetical protein